MDKFLFLKKALLRIMDGSLFNIVFGWVLRIVGLLGVAAAVFVPFGTLWPNIRNYGILGALLGHILFIALSYAVLHVFWIRGTQILESDSDPDYSATPILVIVIKSVGELFLILSTFFGVVGGLASIFMGFDPFSMFMPGNLPGGIISIIAGPLIGLLLLLFYYFIAEIVGAIVMIARNTSKN